MQLNEKRIFIGLGSNMGERTSNIRDALYHISKIPCSLERVSALYETEPVGYTDQAEFLNGVVEIRSGLTAQQLLHALLCVEQMQGRVRQKRWGPRRIDLDILAIESIVIRSTGLTVPHPELASRRFVLVPFTEIAPDFWVAGLNKNVRQLLIETSDKSRVKFYKAIEVI